MAATSENAALVDAVRRGDVNAVQKFVNDGADVNQRDQKTQASLLTLAVSAEHTEVVRLLLNSRATVDIGDKIGRSPLSSASERGNTEIVEIVVNAGALVNKSDFFRLTPLLNASAGGHADVARILINASVNVNAQNADGLTALSYASMYGHIDMVNTLLRAEAFLNTQDKDGRTPLMLAALGGSLETAQALIEAGASINVHDSNGRTPLCHASEDGHVKLVNLLIQNGASINIRDVNGQSPLSLAAGKTPLMLAVERNHAQVAKLLVDHGANIDTRDRLGKTALSMAAVRGNLDILEILIQAGADINPRISRKTPFDNIDDDDRDDESTGDTYYSPNPESQRDDGFTPLCWAIKGGYAPVMKYLIRAGADVNLTNDHGETLLSFTLKRKQFEAGKVLLQAGAKVHLRDLQFPIEPHPYRHYPRMVDPFDTKLIPYAVLQNPEMEPPECISGVNTYALIWNNCRTEVNQMRNTILGESTISLLQYMRETNTDKLAGYLTNIDWTSMPPFEQLFPHYGSLITEHIKMGQDRAQLLFKTNIVLQHCNLEFILPELRKQITDCLSDYDLENIVNCSPAPIRRAKKPEDYSPAYANYGCFLSYQM
ncbi:hypothetical protein LAZ67_6000132 [Cordylochernes scorpioides]|uniref:Alpha-latrotoxin n=1 Tax=Cordylochernes scorpioides TaxID=51811 RepID=A0ABY6KIC3_9ARAC|nr:hypothetical protein LAZ67_6000132 [Cordylochernes scorpioides]